MKLQIEIFFFSFSFIFPLSLTDFDFEILIKSLIYVWKSKNHLVVPNDFHFFHAFEKTKKSLRHLFFFWRLQKDAFFSQQLNSRPYKAKALDQISHFLVKPFLANLNLFNAPKKTFSNDSEYSSIQKIQLAKKIRQFFSHLTFFGCNFLQIEFHSTLASA